MTEQGAIGDFYDPRAFTTFAVPSGTPRISWSGCRRC